MLLVDWSDHDLAKFIKDRDLSLLSAEGLVAYYANENYTTEILIIYNNSDNTRCIYLNEAF